MDQIFNLICENPLFNGISSSDFEKMSACLNAKVKTFTKDEVIILSGNPVKSIGLIVDGTAIIVRESADGNINIVSNVTRSEIFGEVLACADVKQSPVSVIATENCRVLFIDYHSVFTSCKNACSFHTKLVENMLYIIASKNLILNQKLEIISKRTIRERLTHYFSIQSHGRKSFTIPYNREELASFLCVDRSALSNELSKLKCDGLIDFHKNQFTMLK